MAERSYIKGDRPVPDYRLTKFLGKGGFGEVWQATGPGGIEVALKIIPLDNKQGFKEFRAIRMVKNVRNAHLVPILGFWLKDSNGNLFDDQAETDSFIIKGKATELIIAMGLGEKSLMDRLEECQKEGKAGIPAEELLGYMDGAARAIDFLNRPIHNSGSGLIAIQHCDVKPQNIMIVGEDAQLCDFGLARVLGDPRTTQSGNMMMSVPYTSPEMFEASKPSHSSDQYALAVSYVELRTGELPFENPGNPASMMYQIMQGRLDLSRLPDPAEREAVKRATSLDPGKRYATSMEMVRELRRIIEGAVSTPPSKPSGPKPPPGPEAEGNEIVPGYRLVRRLGQGGYGTVWEAQAPGGKRVAVKIIHDVQGSSGRQEFRALELIKSLDHEHLLDLHAYWLKDKDGYVIPDEVRNLPDAPPASTLVIATKLASKNLLQRLNECQREGHPGIPVPELLTYVRQAAQAIDFLNEPRHRFGDQVMSIQHRDIKPENILLVGKTAKVGDFGLAKVLEGTNAQVHGSSTGYTPHYAAPELFRGNVTRWTDQYSLAITYFKLRTGRLPFEANISLGDLLMIHLEGQLDLGALSASERAVIARAAAPEASQRYPTCVDMVNALERVLSGEVRAPKPPLGPTSPEISLPMPSPKLAGAPSKSKRSKPPSHPGGGTVRPEDEDGSAVATAPGQEEPSPVEELVDWPTDTQAPGHDTPAPGNGAAAAWHAAKAPDRPAGSGRGSKADLTTGKAAWNEGTKSKTGGESKVPVGVLVTLLLLGGGAVGFGIWRMIPKPAAEVAASTDTGRKPTQGPAGSTKNGAGKAPTQRSTEPEPPPPPFPDPIIVVREELRKATERLDTEPEAARTKFEEVERNSDTVKDSGDKQAVKALAKLGQVRALFRLGKDTKEAGDHLPDSVTGADNQAVLAVLRLWIKAPDGIGEDTTIPVLTDVIAGLKEITQDLRDALGNSKEGQWVTNLQQQITATLPKQIEECVQAAPQRDGAQLVKALRRAQVIGSFYPEQHGELFEQSRQAAKEKLWQVVREKQKPANPFTQPWKNDDLNVVLSDLKAAQAIMDLEPRKDLELPIRKELALACWYSQKKEGVAKLLEDLPNEPKPDEVRYLFVKGKSQLDDDKKFAVYYAIVQTLKGGTPFQSEFFDQVLQPAITAGVQVVNGKADPSANRRLAECYLVKATFIKDSPGLVKGDWEAEYMYCYEAAFDYGQDPGVGLALSRTHLRWALKHKDAKYLERALKDLGQGNPDPKIADLVYQQRALVHETAATLFKVRKEFEQAIEDLGRAIATNGQQSQYLVDRGRCYQEQALESAVEKRAELTDLARKDLTAALAQIKGALKQIGTGNGAGAEAAKTLKGQQNEAHHWLGVGYCTQTRRDYAQGQQEFNRSLQLAEELGGEGKPIHEMALLYVYNILHDFTLPNLGSAKDRQQLEVPIACCQTLRLYGPRFGGQYADTYETFAANSLATIGQVADDKELCPVSEVFWMLNEGLGQWAKGGLNGLKPGYLGLLNYRNAVALKNYEKNLNGPGFPAKDQLLKDLEAAVNLAKQLPDNFPGRNQRLFDAHFNCARGCLQLQKRAQGLGQAKQALGVPGRSKTEKERVRRLQQELEKLN